MSSKSVPSYRLHKASGQARTIVNGKHIYLGKFNSPESHRRYARLMAELSQPNPPTETESPHQASQPISLLVSEVLIKYLEFT